MNSDLAQLTSDLLPNGTVTEGRCDQGCQLIGPFLLVIGIALFLIFMLQVPYVIITVRYVFTDRGGYCSPPGKTIILHCIASNVYVYTDSCI